MWNTLIKLFHELSETSKLIIFLWFIVIFIVYMVWWVLSWRTQKQLNKDLKRAKKELEAVKQDRDQYKDRLLALDRVDIHVWKMPDAFGNNHFVPREARSTRFIAFINLKGGVGKTTLTLNLGVSFGQRGKRVLLVDLDFQGTLSNMALPENLVNEYRGKEWTTDALLKANGDKNLQNLFFPVKDAENCRAMIAREQLELVELSDNPVSS